MILFWKTKQDSAREEEEDVSRLMTCFIEMKNVFCSLRLVRLWKVNGLRENVHPVLQSVATSQAHHALWEASCHPFPVSFMPPSLFICAARMGKIVIAAGNPTKGSGRLQVYKHELRQEMVPADGAALVYQEEGREIISDTFSKDVGTFTWQPSD